MWLPGRGPLEARASFPALHACTLSRLLSLPVTAMTVTAESPEEEVVSGTLSVVRCVYNLTIYSSPHQSFDRSTNTPTPTSYRLPNEQHRTHPSPESPEFNAH